MDYIIQVIISALSLGSFYALGALGIGLLFGVLRLINFAHGDFITIGAYALIVPSAATVATRTRANCGIRSARASSTNYIRAVAPAGTPARSATSGPQDTSS